MDSKLTEPDDSCEPRSGELERVLEFVVRAKEGLLDRIVVRLAGVDGNAPVRVEGRASFFEDDEIVREVLDAGEDAMLTCHDPYDGWCAILVLFEFEDGDVFRRESAFGELRREGPLHDRDNHSVLTQQVVVSVLVERDQQPLDVRIRVRPRVPVSEAVFDVRTLSDVVERRDAGVSCAGLVDGLLRGESACLGFIVERCDLREGAM